VVADRNAGGPLSLEDFGQFFVGGHYRQTADGQVHIGQMYVQYFVPAGVREPFPVVMWHGGTQTGSNFLGTPDGRPGWCQHFLRRGYSVYVVDQVGRGRSGYFTDVYGATRRPNTDSMSRRFTAPERSNLYPQAHLHDQWPGDGVVGDPVFDQFFASQVEDIIDFSVIERLNRDAGVALLERTGPAILVTHSQSGPIGWEIADRRPDLTKAILAVEPNGPPFFELEPIGAPDWFTDGPLARAWGITRLPLTYEPTLPDGQTLAMQQSPMEPNCVRCWSQQEPARQLPRLAKVPILILTGEASYHALYDHCTSRFLTQAGVVHDFIKLDEVGITGNGHMMMLEKNNQRIADFLCDWLQGKDLGNRLP
jgi:pimeloyl-ACP methyl ester carboxylesterase